MKNNFFETKTERERGRRQREREGERNTVYIEAAGGAA